MQDLSKYARNEFIQIHSRYMSLIIAGSVAVVGLVFAVGVVIGSKGDKTNVCPALDPLAQLDQKVSEPGPPSKDKVPFSFHNVLNAKKDTVPVPWSLKDVNFDADKNATGESPNSKPRQLVSPRATETPIPETVRHKEKGFYTLQVGSFNSQVEATEMVRRLERAGHEAFLISVNMPERGGTWYRVRVGPFSTKREAWKYKNSFESKERLPAFVVKRRSAKQSVNTQSG